MIHRRVEKARADATARRDGVFDGVPFVVKDLIVHSHDDWVGVVEVAHSWAGRRPPICA